MKLSMHLARAAAAVSASVWLASCSLFGTPSKDKPVGPPEPVAPSESTPVATHRFEINPDAADDVIGFVQVTTSTAEDTLSDIARRFNIGYEEIVRAKLR